MRNVKVGLAVLAVAFGGFGIYAVAGPAPSMWMQHKAKQAASAHLFDPTSVIFRNLRVSEEESIGEPVICGELNAKNRMGAYVGWEPFAYSQAIDMAWMVMDDGEGAEYLEKELRKYKCIEEGAT